MTISSVGGLFGYVDPATVAGPGRVAQQVADAGDSLGTEASGATTDRSTSQSASQSPFPSAPPPPSLSSGPAQFAPATTAALIKVQEAAFASTT